MKKQNKYFIFAGCLLALLFAAHFASALEITYPKVPGLPDINTNKPGIGEFAGYFFGLGTYIAGILALISFAIGAVGYIYAGASGNPENKNDATDRMKNSLIGLVLTTAAFVILNTINPALVTPVMAPLPGVEGVYLTNGSQEKPCPESVANVESLPEGYNTIKYVCSGNGPNLLIWHFPETNYGDLQNTNVQILACNGQAGVSGGSFKIAFETPGIYYYLKSDCNGYASTAFSGNQDSIDKTFAQKIKSVRIVNDSSRGLYYGVIFHKGVGFKNAGECTFPIVNTGGQNSCQNVEMPAMSANIFQINGNSGSSGDGVSFYSAPYEDAIGARAGYFDVPAENIKAPYFEQNPNKMCFNYKGVNQPSSYKFKCANPDNNCNNSDYSCQDDSDCAEDEVCNTSEHVCMSKEGDFLCSNDACETFQDCRGSIRIKGSYLVGVYSRAGGAEREQPYCQVFQGPGTTELKVQALTKPGSPELGKVYIIPIK